MEPDERVLARCCQARESAFLLPAQTGRKSGEAKLNRTVADGGGAACFLLPQIHCVHFGYSVHGGRNAQTLWTSNLHDAVQLCRAEASLDEGELARVFHLARSIEQAGHGSAIK